MKDRSFENQNRFMRKLILNLRNIALTVVLMLFTQGYVFAQTSLGDQSESTDKNALPGYVLLELGGLALLLVLVFYAGYKYWRSKEVVNR